MSGPRWRENEDGRIPSRLNKKGARMHVELRNGLKPEASWAAIGTRWTLTGHPFDVVRYRAEVE